MDKTNPLIVDEGFKVTESTIDNATNQLSLLEPAAPIQTRIQTPELVKALGTAAQGGFADAVQLLLETGVDVNAYDGECTALHRAVYFDRPQAVEVLLNHKANPNLLHKNGVSPLVEAARKNLAQIIRMLLNNGANAKEPGLLFNVMPRANAETFQGLVDAGADLQPLHEGLPVLNQAIWHHKPEIVAILLQAGMDPTVQGKAEVSPIVLAAQRGNPESVRLLLRYGQRRT